MRVTQIQKSIQVKSCVPILYPEEFASLMYCAHGTCLIGFDRLANKADDFPLHQEYALSRIGWTRAISVETAFHSWIVTANNTVFPCLNFPFVRRAR
jgi:hypothetical protein